MKTEFSSHGLTPLPRHTGPVGLVTRPAVTTERSITSDGSALQHNIIPHSGNKGWKNAPSSFSTSKSTLGTTTRYGCAERSVQPRTDLRNLQTRKAVIIHVSYCGTKGARRIRSTSAISDLFDLLVTELGYKAVNVRVLTDEPHHVVGARILLSPTFDNILHSMRWLVQDTAPGDQLFFSFNGRGEQTRQDQDGKKRVSWDDAILPSDYNIQGGIKGEIIHNVLVRGLKFGATLTALFDCRHSATIMQLPFEFAVEKGRKGALVVREESGPVETIPSAGRAMAIIINSLLQRGNRIKDKAEIYRQLAKKGKMTLVEELSNNGEVFCFSACAAAEKDIDGFAMTSPFKNGPLTIAFVKLMQTRKALLHEPRTYRAALQVVAKAMSRRTRKQLPSFSSTSHCSLDKPITIFQ